MSGIIAIVGAANQVIKERNDIAILSEAYRNHRRYCKIASFFITVTRDIHHKHKTKQSMTALEDAQSLMKYHLDMMKMVGASLEQKDPTFKLSQTEIILLESECEMQIEPCDDVPVSSGLTGIINSL